MGVKIIITSGEGILAISELPISFDLPFPYLEMCPTNTLAHVQGDVCDYALQQKIKIT